MRKTHWTLFALLAALLISCANDGGILPGTLTKVTEIEADPNPLEGDPCPEFGGLTIETGIDDNGDFELSDEEVDVTYNVCNGPSGRATLLTSTDEPVGSNCPEGGQRVDSGVDANSNGTLDEDEVNEDAVVFVCNGEPISADFSLIVSSDEPAGENCPKGGLRVDIGTDLNGNSTLDADEVADVSYLCADSDIAVRNTDAPWNPYNCLRGGTRIDSGLDLNDNLVLDDDEIEDTQFVCAEAPIYVLDIVAGGRHSCALLSNHTVQCWGDNTQGQLGDGTNTARNSPVKVRELPGSVEQITAGTEHTCALLEDGAAYCWGSNVYGQLGDNDEGDDPPASRNNPTLVAAPGVLAQIEAGDHHTCLIAADSLQTTGELPVSGAVHCVGRNDRGQLGDAGETAEDPNRAFILVEGVDDASDLAAGTSQTCALAGGLISCWGSQTDGRLGDGSADQAIPSLPVPVSLLSGVLDITGGGDHTCAIGSDELGFCWGLNDTGQLGDGSQETRRTPVDINAVTRAFSVAVGRDHGCASNRPGDLHDPTNPGQAFCWGSNSEGQLGNDDLGNDTPNPVEVIQLPDTVGFLKMAAGGGYTYTTLPDDTIDVGETPSHACGAATNGKVYCWGDNTFGQLGDGTNTTSGQAIEVLIDLDPS